MDGIRYQVARGVEIGDGVRPHPLVFLVSDLADAKEVFRRRLVPASNRFYYHQQTLFYTHNNYNNDNPHAYHIPPTEADIMAASI